MQCIAQNVRSSTFVASFHSPNQLDTTAAVRFCLQSLHGISPGGRPFFTVDEVDQIVRSKSRMNLMERLFDGIILGDASRRYPVQSERKFTAMTGSPVKRTLRFFPPMGVLCTTSTPLSFLCQFTEVGIAVF